MIGVAKNAILLFIELYFLNDETTLQAHEDVDIVLHAGGCAEITDDKFGGIVRRTVFHDGEVPWVIFFKEIPQHDLSLVVTVNRLHVIDGNGHKTIEVLYHIGNTVILQGIHHIFKRRCTTLSLNRKKYQRKV